MEKVGVGDVQNSGFKEIDEKKGVVGGSEDVREVVLCFFFFFSGQSFDNVYILNRRSQQIRKMR